MSLLQGPNVCLLSGISYDPDAVAYFLAMATVGYTATSTEKSAANTWITSVKAAGLWSKIDRAYLHIGNLAAQLICCKSLTTRVASATQPTASSNGLTFNGVNSYAVGDVNVSALPSITTTSSHSFSMFGTLALPNNTIIGATVGSDQFYLHGGLVA